MTLSEAIEQGRTKFGTPNKKIDTLVSEVFIFDEKVLKIYRKDIYFFADLKSFGSRKAFYEEDFFWNNNASPEVYLHLWGVLEKDGEIEFVPTTIGEDFVIEMSKIDDNLTLAKILNRGELKKEQATEFIYSLVSTLALLTRERRQKLNHLFERGLYTIMLDNTKSLYDWMISEKSFTKSDAEDIFAALSEGLEKVSYFKETPVKDLSAAFDNNCDNLILLDGKPSYIDILSPMEVWRVVDEYATISRTIVDIEVLQGLEIGKAARDAYASYERTIPYTAMLMHEIRASAIQWPYRYMLNQPELAQKYGAYTKAKVAELRDLLK